MNASKSKSELLPSYGSTNQLNAGRSLIVGSTKQVNASRSNSEILKVQSVESTKQLNAGRVLELLKTQPIHSTKQLNDGKFDLKPLILFSFLNNSFDNYANKHNLNDEFRICTIK